jgi:hypothetical protein
MREPVLADKRTDHQRFVEHAQSLIWRVSGKGHLYDNALATHLPLTVEGLWRVCCNRTMQLPFLFRHS